MSNEEIIAAINQFDIREVRDINGLWNTLQEYRAALESREIPDTHRVVSVELLRHITGSNETLEFVNAHIELRAIIEDKENKQCNT